MQSRIQIYPKDYLNFLTHPSCDATVYFYPSLHPQLKWSEMFYMLSQEQQRWVLSGPINADAVSPWIPLCGLQRCFIKSRLSQTLSTQLVTLSRCSLHWRFLYLTWYFIPGESLRWPAVTLPGTHRGSIDTHLTSVTSCVLRSVWQFIANGLTHAPTTCVSVWGCMTEIEGRKTWNPQLCVFQIWWYIIFFMWLAGKWSVFHHVNTDSTIFICLCVLTDTGKCKTTFTNKSCE